MVLAGAWPPPSVPKEKAYSRKVGAGNGTVCPHLTLNPISAGAPGLEAPRSFPQHPAISGLSCWLVEEPALTSEMNALFWDLKTYEPSGNFQSLSGSLGHPRLSPRLGGHPLPPPPDLRSVLTRQSFRTRAHWLWDARVLCHAIPGNKPRRDPSYRSSS